MNQEMDEKARAYNNPDFNVHIPTDLSGIGNSMPARVGAAAPEFEAELLDGGLFRLAEVRGQRHVVLMMGAITSPMCAIQLPGMNDLWREYGPNGVDFYLVYAKESHPAEHYPHHSSMEQKRAHARDLLELERPLFPILVDTLDGQIHRSYGPWPTSLFLIHKDGRLMYRSTIADAAELRGYLEALMDWDRLAQERPDRVGHTGYTEYILEHRVDESEHYRVYDRAGPKAFEDFWRIFPKLRGKWPWPPFSD